MHIGLAIRIVRQTNRVKLRELAELAELSVPYLSLIEGGKREPSLGSLRRIAEALNVPADVLVVLGMAGEGSSLSADERVHRLALAVEQLVDAESSLRRELGKGGPQREPE